MKQKIIKIANFPKNFEKKIMEVKLTFRYYLREFMLFMNLWILIDNEIFFELKARFC